MLIDDMIFRWKLRRLQKATAKIWAGYGPELDKARAAKDWNEEQSIAASAFFEVDTVRAGLLQLQHNYVTKQAEQLLLPIPPFDTKSANWTKSDRTGVWTLSPELLARLAREVRQERRERVELMFLWPSAFIGLVGGLVGILTAFL